VQSGRFRADLFYRLNVVRIAVPALRDRREDIPPLARHFAALVAARLGRPAPEIEPATLARLAAYHWPGNVRELRNVIERAMILDPAHGLEAIDLAQAGPPTLHAAAVPGDRDLNLRESLNRLERELLLEAQRRAGGVRKQAAHLLGIDPRNLAYYLHKHGLADSPEG
jgi:DNA-binding NtrC family response regulator